MSLNDPSEMRKDCVKKNKNKHSSFTVILQRIKILLAMNKFYSLITVECRSCINTKNKHIPQIFQFQLKCPYEFALFMHCPLLLRLLDVFSWDVGAEKERMLWLGNLSNRPAREKKRRSHVYDWVRTVMKLERVVVNSREKNKAPPLVLVKNWRPNFQTLSL